MKTYVILKNKRMDMCGEAVLKFIKGQNSGWNSWLMASGQLV